MKSAKLRVQKLLGAVMVLFFAWLALSWWEIGMHSPMERPRAGRYNAFVVLAGTQGQEPGEGAAA